MGCKADLTDKCSITSEYVKRRVFSYPGQFQNISDNVKLMTLRSKEKLFQNQSLAGYKISKQ